MRIIRTLALIALLIGVAGAAEPKSEEEKTLYAIGLALSQQIAQFNLGAKDVPFVLEGFSDGALKKTAKVDLKTYMPKISELGRSRASASAAEEKKAGASFLTKAAAEKGAKKTDSGLIYQEITAGTGDSPKATDKVKVHYTGKTTDGSVFDSSVERGQPATFPLNGVIKCWTEGVQMMKVGGKAKLICPSDIAYGDTGSPPKIKPGATLVFEVELLGIEK